MTSLQRLIDFPAQLPKLFAHFRHAGFDRDVVLMELTR
jgi:hypothetical protein